MEKVLFSNQIARDLRLFLENIKYSQLGLIMDSNTQKHCLPLVLDGLPEVFSRFVFTAGESHKNLETCTQIWKWMTEEGFDRKAFIINLGGGVTGDMGGFCAATFKRGIRFINLPTTLLSQVDASVGGKLGIDFMGFKNHIGVFTKPEAVLIGDVFLHTLPESELRSGYAEVIKHGLIQDEAYFGLLKFEHWKEQNWRDIIEKSISIKRVVVEKDPREAGLRKILNFGHSIGHAFESKYLDTDRQLLHGEAIAIGMIAEAYLSHLKSGLSVSELESIEEALLKVFPKFDFEEEEIPGIIKLCTQDKKNEGSQIYFSLLSSIGKCDFNVPVTEQDIYEAIKHYRNLHL
ncbi:3-dehydroquinate synthase [Cecembia lonarensis]|uniref:3-dehydroquinate synthase n=1 Tax=Cecembia lonarensis (strain CCUG 58316 / KCTC 22772 / LW9) TaxID=1225176 RepID=K1L0G6_CECL9|nr:3-dehydroquinate synthase [Cecembia lonarensis]EKB49875.1 3-dehydroquinate synthase [Cecembia lonarensis LW9]